MEKELEEIKQWQKDIYGVEVRKCVYNWKHFRGRPHFIKPEEPMVK